MAESNLKKIEKDFESGYRKQACEALSLLIDTLIKTENSLDYCPKLQVLKKEAYQLMGKMSNKRNQPVK